MTYLPAVFQKILGDTLAAYGLPKLEYPAPRPPDEVRLELIRKTNSSQTLDKRHACSADAI